VDGAVDGADGDGRRSDALTDADSKLVAAQNARFAATESEQVNPGFATVTSYELRVRSSSTVPASSVDLEAAKKSRALNATPRSCCSSCQLRGAIL